MDKKERKRIADKKYRKNNKDKIKKKQNEYYLQNKEKINQYQRDWSKEYYSNNKESESKRKKEYRIDNHKKCSINDWKRYGIIADDWDLIYDVYMNTNNCDYCKKEFKNSLDRNLDHDHSLIDSNNIRGILCRECNTKDKLKGCPPIF